eukprot:COSAG01_NODE_5781_length_4035_cov_128.784553_3_plen_60_part_00
MRVCVHMAPLTSGFWHAWQWVVSTLDLGSACVHMKHEGGYHQSSTRVCGRATSCHGHNT